MSEDRINASHHSDAPKIAILLCTYNGENYLSSLLDSLVAQTHVNWSIHVSDDGSTDGTHNILKNYQERLREKCFCIYSGPQQGFVKNFLSLTKNSNIQADYYAYSDQDDIWKPEKLHRAINVLKDVPKHIPALYCSRTELMNAQGELIGFSPLFKKKPSFSNALVQNIGGGNTMVINDAARSLLQKCCQNETIISHDWWFYLVVSGCGGYIYYDSQSSILYRQHSNNLIGANNNWSARIIRIKKMLKGQFSNWNTRNIQALLEINDSLTPKNQIILQRFIAARERTLIPRILGMIHSRIYRQTLLGNLGLITAIVLKKI